MSQFVDGLANYLMVRYSAEKRPYTDYPAQLTTWLSERYLSEHRGQRLLDLGCGRGEFLHGFAVQGFSAVGMDRACAGDARYPEPVFLGDWEQEGMPFPDASIGVVFNKSVLEHLREPTRTLQECWRILEPGGLLVSMVPDWRAQWRHFYDDWTHVRPYTLTGLTECLASHGFAIRDARRFRQLPWLWERPWLGPAADLAALLPDVLKSRSKTVRFSKEWMLLVVAAKPSTEGRGPTPP